MNTVWIDKGSLCICCQGQNNQYLFLKLCVVKFIIPAVSNFIVRVAGMALDYVYPPFLFTQ